MQEAEERGKMWKIRTLKAKFGQNGNIWKYEDDEKKGGR